MAEKRLKMPKTRFLGFTGVPSVHPGHHRRTRAGHRNSNMALNHSKWTLHELARASEHWHEFCTRSDRFYAPPPIFGHSDHPRTIPDQSGKIDFLTPDKGLRGLSDPYPHQAGRRLGVNGGRGVEAGRKTCPNVYRIHAKPPTLLARVGSIFE